MKFFLAFLLLCPAVLFGQAIDHGPVFPRPNFIKLSNKFFATDGTLTIDSTTESVMMYDYFHAKLEAEHQIHLQLVKKSESASIRLKKTGMLLAEGYQLTVKNDFAQIEYTDYNGLLYAMQSLSQLIYPGQTIVQGLLKDEPAFGYRGVHLDCSRHFFTIPELEAFIDEMAALKFNRFHWHLTDDQGWRLEIKQFPKLTSVGAYRDSTVEGHFSKTPRTYDVQKYGGYYTQEQAKKLVEYAALRGITIIPEIEMPGHARAALAAYPELGCTGEQLPVPGLWGVFEDVFCSREATRTFMKAVLTEVMAIFPSTTIHIGGDEVPKVRWEICPHCQETMKQNGIKDVHALQSFFIQDIEKFVNGYGKTIIGWDEILEGGLAPNAKVMSWRGEEGGIEAANAQHDVVMTPTSTCYFDYYQSGHPSEPLAIGGFLPLEKVYAYNPMPAALKKENQRYLLGAQANLWTEYLPTMKAVQYNAFPRLVAMAEVVWTKPSSKSTYAAFVQSLVRFQFPRFEQGKIHYSTAALEPKLSIRAVPNGLQLTADRLFPSMIMKYGDENFDTLDLERTAMPHLLKIPVTSYMEGKAIRSTDYSFTTHLAIGIPVKFTSPPHPKYSVHDSLGLTDGVVGQIPWKGDQWLGFSNDTVQFTIDLKAPTEFSNMALNTLNDEGSWIYRPKTVLVETSKNGKKFKKLAVQAIVSDRISIAKSTKARFVRVTLVNDTVIPAGKSGAGTTPWTFIDELILSR